MDQVKNFAKALVDPDGNYDSTSTEIDIIFISSNPFPAPPFNATWWNVTDYPDPADDPGKEIVRVTDQVDSTLTITRAQEGTSAEDHNEAGKTYSLVAGLTAKVLQEDLVGDVFGSGPALTFNLAAPNVRLGFNNTDERFIQLDTPGITIQSVRTFLGDSQGQGNSSVLDIDDGNSRVVLSNLNLATTQIESATVAVGTLVGKLAIRDGAGDIVGYLPIYGSIT